MADISFAKLGSPQRVLPRPNLSRPVPSVDDEIIALIYQGPLESSPWQGFLQKMTKIWDCDYAALSLQDIHMGVPSILIAGRHDLERTSAAALTSAHRRLAHLDPLANALSVSGEILMLSEVITADALAENAFFKEIIQPRGMQTQIGMHIKEPSGCTANFGLMNGADGRSFGRAEKEFLASCRDHLERALALFSRIQRSEQSKKVFDEALGRLHIGAFLLDAAGKVIDQNAAGRAFCAASHICIDRGQLTLPLARDNRRLKEVIHQAGTNAHANITDGYAVILRTSANEDSALDILVRTVPQASRLHSNISPKIVVYISSSSEVGFGISDRFIAQLLSLTPAEAKLAILLAEGHTLKAAAATLGLTENTTRTYSKQIFAKTGIKRQAELIRLILKSVVLLA